MDWLEQWFGIAPDNGDGSLELLIVVTAVAVVSIGIVWRNRTSRAALIRFFTQGILRR
jgi:hypothetical protein